ncbi:MAG: acetyltransferase [Planctomycetaceae bacterium]|nr:acetyltransferase [Planctomycetaceae bacterium]
MELVFESRILDEKSVNQGHSAVWTKPQISVFWDLVQQRLEDEMEALSVVSIRSANSSDAVVLANLGRQTFHETFAAQNKPGDMDDYINDSFMIEQLNAQLAEPVEHTFLFRTLIRVGNSF